VLLMSLLPFLLLSVSFLIQIQYSRFAKLMQVLFSLITLSTYRTVPPMAAEPERRFPWGGGAAGSVIGGVFLEKLP